MLKYPVALLSLCLTAAACGGDSLPAQRAVEANLLPAGNTAPAWTAKPREGAALEDRDGATVVVTGPHTVVWRLDEAPLQPPYRVRAVLHKQRGRIHEGYGIIFGGAVLDAPEEQQAYSYFLIRGDGSFLIRRREGPDLPILRPWTSNAAIARDTDQGGQPNELEVEVGRQTTVFRVNGAEVARLPSTELRVGGVPGLRVAHDVQLEIREFQVSPGL
jgi:hypothetical protein